MSKEESFLYAKLVRDLVNSNAYQKTIGLWLQEIRNSAVQNLANLKHGDQAIWGYQAEIKVVDLLLNKIQLQLNKAEAERVKRNNQK